MDKMMSVLIIVFLIIGVILVTLFAGMEVSLVLLPLVKVSPEIFQLSVTHIHVLPITFCHVM